MRWMESAMEYCRMLGLWDYETMKLTSFHNGMIIDVDREKISDIGPHIDGGSIVKVNGYTYHVQELVNEILKNK